MIRTHRGIRPKVAASAYIDSSAQVIGDMEVGERASIWSNASVRGDVHRIRIGEESAARQWPVIVGNRVTIVAAGALVPEGLVAPRNSVVMGSPATRRGEVRPEERERFQRLNRNYIGYRQEYLDEQSS
ncbi:MAG: gamma carbonic anhydrase family protein [bacterium]|nr:gamma carbonic anhydrase family protein [bacterium]